MGKWLVKTEPEKYSIEDLKRDGQTTWDGVRNALAQRYLRQMEMGELVMFYHSVTDKAIAGMAEVVRTAYLDATDTKSRSVCVDLKFKFMLEKPVTLTAIKEDPKLQELPLIKMSRLSVMPITEAHWKILLKKSGNA